MVGSLDAVRAVLAAARVAYPDLVLVVKPSLVELGPGGVENPAAEPPPHGGQICLVGLAVRGREGGQQMGICPHKAVPDVENGLDLGSEQVAGASQRD